MFDHENSNVMTKFRRHWKNWQKQGGFFKDLSPHCECDLDLKDRNPTFLHDTLGHDKASPYQISRRLNGSEDPIVRTICQIFPDLEDSNQKLPHADNRIPKYTPLHPPSLGLVMMHHYTICVVANNSKVQEIWNKQLFNLRISARTVTLTVRIGTQTFRLTLQVIVSHDDVTNQRFH